jgi:hypothetical protein
MLEFADELTGDTSYEVSHWRRRERADGVPEKELSTLDGAWRRLYSPGTSSSHHSGDTRLPSCAGAAR